MVIFFAAFELQNFFAHQLVVFHNSIIADLVGVYDSLKMINFSLQDSYFFSLFLQLLIICLVLVIFGSVDFLLINSLLFNPLL